ncbi:hypothetical protein A0O32_2761 [Anoxybacillus flavithermus]|nr:hypothetical protein A0O32_2761 [Anoxybacillus flavithermus]
MICIVRSFNKDFVALITHIPQNMYLIYMFIEPYIEQKSNI